MTGKTLITVVLDETGSMSGRRQEVISGFNEFILTQQDKALGDCSVTLVKFNSEDGVRTVYKDTPIAEVPKLESKDYITRGLTPLYDALGEAITATKSGYETANRVMSQLVGKNSQAATPMVIILVITDGEENSSSQFTRQQIFEIVAAQRKLKWSFVFLGSDMDAWAVERQAAAMQFAAGNVRGGVGYSIKETFADITHGLKSYRHAYTSSLSPQSFDAQKVAATLDTAANDFFKMVDKKTGENDDQHKRHSDSGD